MTLPRRYGSDGEVWQEIATAPKDGTDILLTDGKTWTRKAYWARRSECWSVDSVVGGSLAPATHWAPLPSWPAPAAPVRDVARMPGEKLDWECVRQMRREYGAFGTVSGEVLTAVDRLLAELEGRDVARLRGELVDVAGPLAISLASFEQKCLVHLADEQAKPNPDNALIGTLADAVRLVREYPKPFIPLPSGAGGRGAATQGPSYKEGRTYLTDAQVSMLQRRIGELESRLAAADAEAGRREALARKDIQAEIDDCARMLVSLAHGPENDRLYWEGKRTGLALALTHIQGEQR